jgi:S1-C subfamily serine protease
MDDERKPYDDTRRATDGLNWRPRDSVEAQPSPSARPASQTDTLTPSSFSVARTAAGGLLAGLVGGALAALVVVRALDDNTDRDVSEATGQAGKLTVEQTSAIAETAASGRPAVVRIESTRKLANGATEQDVGSGFVFDTDGHIVTNAHVVLGTDTLKVILADGTELPGILLGHDHPFSDVAVLQIGGVKMTPLVFGNSDALKLGETVVAIGNPLAEFEGSVSVGVISGLNRVRTFDTVRQDDILQTDAAINNGNSGGALLNLRGEVIGMPTAILRQSRGGQPVEGIAFALPSNRVAEVARRIVLEGGSYPRPSMGVEHTDITAEVLRQTRGISVDEGGLVTSVPKGGVGDQAGLQVGDVITNIGDQVVNRKNPVLNALMKYQPGQTVRVVFNRNGRIIEAEVRLAKRG